MHASEILARLRVIDLTQPLGPQTALWPGSAPFLATVDGTVEDDGCFIRTLRVPEHAGTHLDAPAHFVAGGVTVEGIAADRLVVEAAVIDIADACADDPDHVLEVAEVLAHEERHGPVPAGGAVLVRTGWDRHVRDADRYLGPPDALRFPGGGVAAARLLVERGVAGIGIDTLGIDAGAVSGCDVHVQVTLPAGLWHVEGLVGLERLPARGALLVVGAPLVVGSSGVTARVIALVSKEA